jgi:hypothetical protein
MDLSSFIPPILVGFYVLIQSENSSLPGSLTHVFLNERKDSGTILGTYYHLTLFLRLKKVQQGANGDDDCPRPPKGISPENVHKQETLRD